MSNLVPVPVEARKGFKFRNIDSSPTVEWTWSDWANYHTKLGQELAKRMREYPGPNTDDDIPPPGGTPIQMRLAA